MCTAHLDRALRRLAVIAAVFLIYLLRRRQGRREWLPTASHPRPLADFGVKPSVAVSVANVLRHLGMASAPEAAGLSLNGKEIAGLRLPTGARIGEARRDELGTFFAHQHYKTPDATGT